MAVCAVGGLRSWRFARLAICAVGVCAVGVCAVGGLRDLRLAVSGLRLAFAFSGLRLAFCVWRFAFGGLRLVVCGWRFAFGGLCLAVCFWWFAFSGLRFAVCGWWFAVGGLRLTIGGLRFALDVVVLQLSFAVALKIHFQYIAQCWPSSFLLSVSGLYDATFTCRPEFRAARFTLHRTVSFT